MTWRRVQLKHVASVSVSNVDKKSSEDERSVRLCNYVDVYKTDLIDGSLDFMRGTASPAQIRSFSLRAGDTVITKDSETAHDIAVPAYVGETIEGLVCGYHLAVVRPGPEVDPRYLFWCLSSEPMRNQAAVAATGVTRFGLRQEAIRNAVIDLPSISDQRWLSAFLDAQRFRIYSLLARLGRELTLVEERADAVLDLALLLPNAVYRKLKYLARVTVGIVVAPSTWYVSEGGVPALRGLNVKPGVLAEDDLVQISHEGHALHLKSRLSTGDVVVVRTGQAGAAAVVSPKFDGANCIDLLLIRRCDALNPRFLEFYLNCSKTRRTVAQLTVGSIQAHYNVGAIRGLDVPVPPLQAQEAIVHHLEAEDERLGRLRRLLRQEQALLVERRNALVTAAVTGQLDVTTARGVA